MANFLVIASIYGVLFYRSQGFDESSRAYIVDNVHSIVASWSMNALKTRASPRLLGVLNKQGAQADCLMKTFSQLGTLTHEGKPEGHSDMGYFSSKGEATATYQEKDQFEYGVATISVGLILVNGQWWIQSFHVTSPALDS